MQWERVDALFMEVSAIARLVSPCGAAHPINQQNPAQTRRTQYASKREIHKHKPHRVIYMALQQ